MKLRPKPAKPRGCLKKRTKVARALLRPGTNIPMELIAPVPAPVATFNIAEGAAPVVAGFKATKNVPKKTKRGASREVGESHL